jgi:hypothetical protein
MYSWLLICRKYSSETKKSHFPEHMISSGDINLPKIKHSALKQEILFFNVNSSLKTALLNAYRVFELFYSDIIIAA